MAIEEAQRMVKKHGVQLHPFSDDDINRVAQDKGLNLLSDHDLGRAIKLIHEKIDARMDLFIEDALDELDLDNIENELPE